MRVLLFSIISVFSAILICFGFSCYYSYFYPTDYKEIIVANANNYDVEPEMIASIINVESGYNQYARSNKGAIGLMQILPSTAEWVGKRIGKQFSDEELFEPSLNIQIGTYYFSYLMQYFQNEELAVCAYNAGMGNVNRWLSKIVYSQDGKTLDEIPFRETKNYLKSVERNKKVYRNKF